MNFQHAEVISSTLYIVPTPIGNLEDITYRALSVLRSVDLIAAEDTRNTGFLLQNFSIKTRLFIYHQYNEKEKIPVLLAKLRLGNSIALVSDAGTPLISDPGYSLVRSCLSLGFRVIPLPGACAVITALSASGLPSNRFCFEGFLPVRRRSRINYFQKLLRETRTLIFYDSKHRIIDTLEDMISVLGPNRRVVLARELTKIWETIYYNSLQGLLEFFQKNKRCLRGEIVLILEGYQVQKNKLEPEVEHMIQLLAKELPFRKVIDLIVSVYGSNKNFVYQYLLKNNISG